MWTTMATGPTTWQMNPRYLTDTSDGNTLSVCVGIDIGNRNSSVAVFSRNVVKAIPDEYGLERTPSCVAFTDRLRLCGSEAKRQQISNPERTVTNFFRLVGKKPDDFIVQNEKFFSGYSLRESADGRITIPIQYRGCVQNLTPEQILAIQMKKMRSIAETYSGCEVHDVVLSIPYYFTDLERRSVMNAAYIAELRCVGLITDITAAATAYAFRNSQDQRLSGSGMLVAFVIMGHVNTQVAVYLISTACIKVIACTFDPRLGGRDFTHLIFERLAREFDDNYGEKITDSPKATVRLLEVCEKLKTCAISGHSQGPIFVERLMSQTKLHFRLETEEFKNLSESLLTRFTELLKKCLLLARLEPRDLDTVELIGGGCQLPFIKEKVLEVFGRIGRTTVDPNVAIAQGCAIQAAVRLKTFLTYPLNVIEVSPYPVELFWDFGERVNWDTDLTTEIEDGPKASGLETSISLFPQHTVLPCTKNVVFRRKAMFDFQLRYFAEGGQADASILIRSFHVSIDPQDSFSLFTVRITIVMDNNGVITVPKAQMMSETHNKNIWRPITNNHECSLHVVESAMRCTDEFLQQCKMTEMKLSAETEEEREREIAENELHKVIQATRLTFPFPSNDNNIPACVQELLALIEECDCWSRQSESFHRPDEYEERIRRIKLLLQKVKSDQNHQQLDVSVIDRLKRFISRLEDTISEINQGDRRHSHITLSQMSQLENYLAISRIRITECEDWQRGVNRKREAPQLSMAKLVTELKDMETDFQRILDGRNLPQTASPLSRKASNLILTQSPVQAGQLEHDNHVEQSGSQYLEKLLDSIQGRLKFYITNDELKKLNNISGEMCGLLFRGRAAQVEQRRELEELKAKCEERKERENELLERFRDLLDRISNAVPVCNDDSTQLDLWQSRISLLADQKRWYEKWLNEQYGAGNSDPAVRNPTKRIVQISVYLEAFETACLPILESLSPAPLN
ncbi:unnamed protein product [Calicophoron daubneyi]|uniref:Uncharacterized protein n=1 Tax=Calicophoron daubneyi TaxID=300641 RepID=A0AAV2TJT5_CALDB